MDYEIKLSQEDLETLLKLIYLGNWLANANREEERMIKKFENLKNQILSSIGNQNIKKEYENFKYDNEIISIIEEYNEITFWDLLITRLAERDMILDYGEDNLKNLSDEEYKKINLEYQKKYYQEFFENGLWNLIIK
ncbi:MAG: hypothetical protein N2323_03185 [candidate division WOR-3 bacterium]|nr:hypothetical protein [candidate division WOR-3 bacterium]MCX7836946.1 hypothetical protein [candidate division WOR-3 bacterium]MDW8114148.1 hypothetical protein [candidate division WOR-3 bacterium]